MTPRLLNFSPLIPELYCSDFQRSLDFYTKVLGFLVVYIRKEERFAFLEREGAQLMLEQTVNLERIWVSGELQYPFGRGMSLQMRTTDVEALYKKCNDSGAKLFLPLEKKWYQVEGKLLGNYQFIVHDPDGYLLRFSQDLGEKEV